MFDVNPCDDRQKVKDAMEECKDNLQSVTADNPFNVDFCRYIAGSRS